MPADALLTSPVTVVSALAGYGKTTRLEPLRQRRGTVWLDARPGRDLGGNITSALADPACDVLVVDDAHLLDPDGKAVEVLARALHRPPPDTRIAIAGRPPIPVPISAGLARGTTTEVAEPQLALQVTEVAALLGEALGKTAMPLVPRLHERTAGWPALVTLVIAQLGHRDAHDWPRMVESCCSPGGPGLEFLAQQVFDELAPAERDVLQLVAHADEMSATVLAAAGLDPSRAVSGQLVRRRLLGRGDDESQLAISPVIRTAVRAIMPVEPDVVADQLGAAAHRLVADGRPDEALTTLVRLGDHDRVAEVLAEHGSQLLRDGKIDAVIAASRAIPEAERSPDVVMNLGQALQVRGDYEGALHCYRQLAGDADELPPRLAWRIGVIYYLNGEPRRADEYYQRGRLGDEDTADEAHLLGWMASAAWMTGDVDLCSNLALRSHEAAQRSGDPAALATAHVAQGLHAGLAGSRRELAEHYERAIDYADQAGDRLQAVRARSNLAAHRASEGLLTQALDELAIAGRQAAEAGFAAFEALCRINAGEALLQLARLDEAMAAYEDAQRVYQRMGSRKIAYALNGIGDVHRNRGSLSLAKAAYAESLATLEKGEDLQAYVPAHCGLARVLASSDPERAEKLAREATQPAGPGQAQAWLTLGWIRLGREPDEALSMAARAEEVAGLHRDWAALAESQELAAMAGQPADRGTRLREAEQSWTQAGGQLGLLRLQFARGRLRHRSGAAVSSPPTRPTLLDAETEDAGHLLRSAGVAVDGPLAAGLLAALPPLPVPAVQVTTLGRFAITVDGEDVDATRWQSRKARTLFKILVARYGTLTSREELMDLLWPDEEPAKLANRFAVALTTLRRGLDPHHEHPSDWIVVSRSGALSLDTAQTSIDLVGFQAAAKSGLRLASAGHSREAERVLTSAASQYGGAFLPEDRYEDWAISVRDEAANQLLRCLCALGELALRSGDLDQAHSYAQQAVRHEPADPRAHDLLTRSQGSAR